MTTTTRDKRQTVYRCNHCGLETLAPPDKHTGCARCGRTFATTRSMIVGPAEKLIETSDGIRRVDA